MREYQDITDDRGRLARVPVNGTGADVRTHTLSPGQAKWLRQRRRELVGSRQPMGTIAFLALCVGVFFGLPFGLALVAIVHYLLYTLLGSRGELFVLSILGLAAVWFLKRWRRRRAALKLIARSVWCAGIRCMMR